MGQENTRKARAIMAGGLVLGVGAVVTLAAWTDSEFAEGLFTAGSYNLEGSDDGTTYADQDTAGTALDLTFSGLFANLTADTTVHAAYWLRLDAATTTDGTLTPAGVTATDTVTGTANAGAISYEIIQVTAGDCELGTATGTVVASGTTLNAQEVANSVDLVANAAGTPGTAVPLCVSVTTGPEGTFLEGGNTSAVWQFTSVSD
ncbi:SipW-dependent-type signal peptide-containing protein [Zhihengliuella alba]